MTKFFAIVLAVAVAYSEARTLRMSRGSSCSCRHSIQRERDNAVKKHNEIAENFDRLAEFVSMTNCEEGYVFNYEASTHDTSKVLCEKCPENHYRAYNNATCLHCPEGYIASEGSSRCKRAGMYDLVHTLCPSGSVVGDNPFGVHRDSCKKCEIENREYMPYLNNADDCLICPAGSVITRDSDCKKCPVGYYEHNNKCIECAAGTYNDIEGQTECMICNNDKAIAYNSIGGTNCEDSSLFNLADKLNSYAKMDYISNPLITGMHIGSAIIYNNRRIIQEISMIGGVIGMVAAGIISG